MNLGRPLPSFRAAARLKVRSAWAIAALCLSACLDGGGTGTDTENGIIARVTDNQGAPLAGVSLKLFDPAYRPDLGQPAADPLAGASGRPVSDAQGYARFSLQAAGKFVVEGVSAQGATLFFDTLAVPDPGQAVRYTFRARASTAFRGKVKLVSGMRIDTGRVFIRGTGRMCAVDSAGGYDLGLLPADAERMGLGVRLVSNPVSVLNAVQMHPVSMDTSRPASYTCKILSGDSAAKAVDAGRASADASTAAPLDSVRVDSVLKACGTVEKGSVVNYSGDAPQPGTSVLVAKSVNLLVLNGTEDVQYKSSEPVLVPLAECAPAAGKETTTYEVDVRAGQDSNDLIVGDVSPKCLSPGL